jgi:hypothetical protein
MSSYHHFPWLRLSFSLSISISYETDSLPRTVGPQLCLRGRRSSYFFRPSRRYKQHLRVQCMAVESFVRPSWIPTWAKHNWWVHIQFNLFVTFISSDSDAWKMSIQTSSSHHSPPPHLFNFQGPEILKMTQNRRGSWRGHWLGDAAVLQWVWWIDLQMLQWLLPWSLPLTKAWILLSILLTLTNPQPDIQPFDPSRRYYEVGEIVTNEGKVWRCRVWPYSWRCHQDGYEAGQDYHGLPLYKEAWEEVLPTNAPSIASSNVPSASPSNVPSESPSKVPSVAPSNVPSVAPSNVPTTATVDQTLSPAGATLNTLDGIVYVAADVAKGCRNEHCLCIHRHF